jgi:hypothetical protein
MAVFHVAPEKCEDALRLAGLDVGDVLVQPNQCTAVNVVDRAELVSNLANQRPHVCAGG